MGDPTIVVARHWRPEMADIAQTLRDVVATRDSSAVTVIGGGRWPRPSAALARPDILVVSDTASIPRSSDGPRSKRTPRIVRVWWNEASEVVAFVAAREPDPSEVHVCFFADTAAQLRAAGVETRCIPYAFAPLQGPAVRRAPFVGYTGEVDVSDHCFAGLEPSRGSALSEMATELAAAVVEGSIRVADADAAIRAASETDATTAPIVGWSMRNRARHLLLLDIVAAFPGAAKVRGSDWQRLGFDAAKTSFSRRRRRRDYGTNLVSLDLGSKSTTAALYPRSAEVMSVAGGLVQFDSGAPSPPELPTLAARRAPDSEGLITMIERLLHLAPDELQAENVQLQQEYSAVRLTSGVQLLDVLIACAS